MQNDHDHYCVDISALPTDTFLQLGMDVGRRMLIVGEAPAPNGWRKSGRAFYSPEGRLLPTGKNLNQLLEPYNLSVETCSFTELVKCFVGKDRGLLSVCGKKCWPLFVRQLELLHCGFILLLGVQTLKIFNDQVGSHLLIGELGSITLNQKQYKVLPIYHPSPVGPQNHRKNIDIFGRSSVVDYFEALMGKEEQGPGLIGKA